MFSAMPAKKRQVHKLVEEKRLEFTSGTWVMVDEATPHLYSMLDQMIEGNLKKKKRIEDKTIAVKLICNTFESHRTPMAKIPFGRVSKIGMDCRSFRTRPSSRGLAARSRTSKHGRSTYPLR